MQNLITSISGIRGMVGRSLTPAIMAEYASAFGAYLKQTVKAKGRYRLKVCVGRDSRPSGSFFEPAVISGLCASGIDVVQLGVVTTPCVGVMLSHLGCAGGIVITASHNPVEYNGLKLLLNNGAVPSDDVLSKIQQIYCNKDFDYVSSANSGQSYYSNMVDEVHIDRIRTICEPTQIAPKKFKVVLDCVNGAGSRVTTKLLEVLGCEVVGLNLELTGDFAHAPELVKENLTSLCKAVKEHKADVGFAQGPDADRLAVVGNDGLCVDEEYVFALVLENALAKKRSDVVTNFYTSKIVDIVAESFDCKVFRTPVGDANIAGAMVRNNCYIGGEGNGGVIDLRVTPVRDSLVAIAHILQLMADKSQKISDIINDSPPLAIAKNKVRLSSEKMSIAFAEAKSIFSEAKFDNADGCRFDFGNAWVHLKASNTEPVMRYTVEAENPQIVEKYVFKLKKAFEKAKAQ